jgi:hypothetical protein
MMLIFCLSKIGVTMSYTGFVKIFCYSQPHLIEYHIKDYSG